MVGKSENVLTKKNYGGLAFIPMLAFLVPYLGCGLFFYFRGESSPFSFVPREAALMFGIAAAQMCIRDSNPVCPEGRSGVDKDMEGVWVILQNIVGAAAYDHTGTFFH